MDLKMVVGLVTLKLTTLHNLFIGKFINKMTRYMNKNILSHFGDLVIWRFVFADWLFNVFICLKNTTKSKINDSNNNLNYRNNSYSNYLKYSYTFIIVLL